ncbi:unnamed protein product, partial [Oppiella nova]
NSLVIIVEILVKQPSNNLHQWLINMAASDVILAVFCVPFSFTGVMYGQWVFPHWLCPVAQSTQLLSHSKLILYLSWILGSMYSAFWLSNTKTNPFMLNTTNPMDNETYYECSYAEGMTDYEMKVVVIYNFVFTYLLPFIVITFSYLAITKRLLVDPKTTGGHILRKNKTIRNKVKDDFKRIFLKRRLEKRKSYQNSETINTRV